LLLRLMGGCSSIDLCCTTLDASGRWRAPGSHARAGLCQHDRRPYAVACCHQSGTTPAPQLDRSDQRRVSTALARTCNAEEAPRSNALASGTLFFCYVIRGSPPGDWVGGLQWIALLYRHSSRKCAAPRRLSPKPKKESHRPRPNLLTVCAPNPLSLGRPSQSVATQDGWPPAERPLAA
jgi:hypothetical protein